MSKYPNKIIDWNLNIVWANGYEEDISQLIPDYVLLAVEDFLNELESTEIAEE